MDTGISLRGLSGQIAADLKFYGGSGIKSSIAVILFDARFRLMCSYRIARYLYLRKNKQSWVHRLITFRQITRGSNDISPRANIGSRISLPHPLGIVIGDGVTIEDDVTIFQYTTFGSHGRSGQSKQYPVIKSGAKIFAGAKVIGGVVVGQGALVGANSLVMSDVPDGARVAGVPAKVL